MLSTKLKEAAGNSADATLYVDDVFSTYLYTGNGSTQTITNGIDLAGKGGMVWTKSRSLGTSAEGNRLVDTLNSGRSFGWTNISDSTSGRFDGTVASFSPTGYFLNGTTYGNDGYNTNAVTYASWTFRKAAKFFDVVTYTGTGSARTIAHSLGVAPGMIIVKRTDTTGNWQVYSNGLTSAAYSMQLNLTNVQASAPTVWNSTAPTSSVFSVGTDATVNASGGTYVAYLFAHDTSSTGIIQCGSYNRTDGVKSIVNLGWEPQFIIYKTSSGASQWLMLDVMRSWTGASNSHLFANLANAETTGNIGIMPTATGFQDYTTAGATDTIIYMAIRRPNKPPTTGTQVFSPAIGTNLGVGSTAVTSNFPIDASFEQRKTGGFNGARTRLQGNVYLSTASTSTETASTALLNDNMVGLTNNSGGNFSSDVFWNFRRAPGFFDVVCYTGTGVATTQAHNLGVVPELIIVKKRSGTARRWAVQPLSVGTRLLVLNATDAQITDAGPWNNTNPTSSVFRVGADADTNPVGDTLVAYLFATLAGISKVGSYTGNGSSQNINCGFAAGARFFLVKATSTTGSWWVWDSARGITSGNDPALQLNSTAAEITTADAVDPYSPGITVNQEATCSINASGVSYIFLAIA